MRIFYYTDVTGTTKQGMYPVPSSCSIAAVLCCSSAMLDAGEKNYPWATRMTNTYDVGLPDAVTDDEYLATLAEWLPRLFERHRPQLAFFQAGVDAMAKDSFGRWVKRSTYHNLRALKCMEKESCDSSENASSLWTLFPLDGWQSLRQQEELERCRIAGHQSETMLCGLRRVRQSDSNRLNPPQRLIL